MVHVAGIDQLLDQAAALGRPLKGHKQRQQRLPVPGAGVLLQGPAQRLVLDAPLRRQAADIVARNANGFSAIAFVLGQVQRDAADKPPEEGSFR